MAKPRRLPSKTTYLGPPDSLPLDDLAGWLAEAGSDFLNASLWAKRAKIPSGSHSTHLKCAERSNTRTIIIQPCLAAKSAAPRDNKSKWESARLIGPGANRDNAATR